ncbi:MAG TPA: UbiA family prenyltransferase [Solirubrobacteraceae bacterium]|nr:UbiA family prenyltransferase [Solirubrobacteraceae bacterium]
MAVERAAPAAVVDEPGGRSLLRTVGAVAAIRRMEFYVVELTIFAMPVLVVATSTGDLTRWTVLEGLAMFFALYTLGDVINCLADRDLDAVYKTRLSRAVYRIGVRRVTAVVIGSTVVGVALAVHLAAATGRWLILGLVVVGVFLGIEYSVRPLYFKGRGIWHLVCLWLLLYFLPMLCASLLVVDALTAEVTVLAAAYATVEMGIILINTSEDLPEDRTAGIRTTTVALGLVPTLWLACAMVAVGGAAFCASWLHLDAQHGVAPLGYLAVGALALVCATVLARLLALARAAAHAGEQAAIRMVKANGPLVPVAATLVGWMGVLCGVVVFGARVG